MLERYSVNWKEFGKVNFKMFTNLKSAVEFTLSLFTQNSNSEITLLKGTYTDAKAVRNNFHVAKSILWTSWFNTKDELLQLLSKAK